MENEGQLDLSSPEGSSVNDGIEKELRPLQCVDEVVDTILKLGPGTELAKIYIQNAYRIVPDDRHLLGMKWQGKL